MLPQPAIAAAICLMGTNCSAHIGYLEKTLAFADTYPGYHRGHTGQTGEAKGHAPQRPGGDQEFSPRRKEKRRANKPAKRAKSTTRCHEKLRFFVALPKQPHSRSIPRIFAATVAPIKIIVSGVRIKTAPLRKYPVSNARPQRISSQGK